MTRKSRKSKPARSAGPPRVAPEEGYVTVAEAARIAGVSAPTIYYWIRLGELKDVEGRPAVLRKERGAAIGGGRIWILRAAAEARVPVAPPAA
jgi:transposase-like protein